MENAVIYEITVMVQAELVEKYEDYMRRQHIPDLLATGYFQSADFSSSSAGRYRVRYLAFDQNALDKYLGTGAERLRADFIEHFPEGIEVSREVWRVIESWSEN